MKVSDEIYNLAKKAGIANGKINEEFMFTIQAVNLFYYNNNIGENDIRESFVDGSKDGGIDYICIKDDEMHIVQGKSTQTLTYDDIRNAFLKMNETIKNFENNKFLMYNRKLQSTYLNIYDSLPDNNKNISLVIFTNTKLTDEIKAKNNDLRNDISLINYTLYVFDCEEIEEKIINLQQGNNFIKYDTLNLYENKQFLKYGENGIIVNITAESLRRLYIKQKK